MCTLADAVLKENLRAIGVELLAGLEIEPPAWVLFLIEGALALVAKEVLRNAGC